MNLAEVIRSHRKVSGLSRTDLSRLAGVGKTVVFDIEHGKTSVQWDTVSKLLAALNISIVFDSPLLRKNSLPLTKGREDAPS